MKPRIVFVLGTIGIDGASMWQLTLLQHLDHAKYDVHLLLLNRIINSSRIAEVLKQRELSITELGAPIGWSWRMHRYLGVRGALKRLQPDLVFNSNLKASSLLRLAAKSVGAPSINIYHNDMPHFRPLLRIQDRMSRRWSAHCVGVSEAVSRSLAGFDRSRVSTIHNCVERQGTRATRDEARDKYDLRSEQTVFLNVARLQPFKNQMALIEGFARHARDYPDDVLLIAGWGPLAEQLSRRVEQLQVQSQVRLLGAVDDVWDLYAASDFFILPSKGEGFPIAMLEAISCELPLVVTNLPQLQEIVDGNAVIIEGTDGSDIHSALQHTRSLTPMEVDQMRSQSRVIYEQKIDPKAMARQYEALIDRYALRHTTAGAGRHAYGSEFRAA